MFIHKRDRLKINLSRSLFLYTQKAFLPFSSTKILITVKDIFQNMFKNTSTKY